MKKLIVLWALAAALWQPAMVRAEEQLLDEIVAVVDDDVILRSDLDRTVANIIKQFNARGVQLPPRSVLERQVLERLILQDLQVQKARQAGIRVSEPELNAAIERIAAQNGLSVAQMRAAIEAEGQRFADFREDIRREMLSDRVSRGWAESQVKVSDDDIDLFLAANDLNQGEVKLRHILIAVPENATPEQVEEARAKAEKVYQQLTDGADFASLATQVSAGQKALEGGDLGWRPLNQLPQLFADQIKAMKTGEITHPVRSPSGFHIIKLEAKRDSAQKMIDEVKAQHIMVGVSELMTPEDAMQRINEIYEKLQKGEDFAKLAEKYSDDHASAPLGGDMGWFQPRQYGERFAKALESLKPGEFSKPFQTQAGWHIVKLNGKRTSDVTEEFKRQQAREALRQRKIAEEREAWLRQIRGEAFVDIRL